MSTPEPGARTPEPVLIAHAVHTLLAAAVATGWVMIPNRDIDIAVSVAGLLLSTVAAVATRARVSPTSLITWSGLQSALRAMLAEELARIVGAAQPAPVEAPAEEPALAELDVATAAIPRVATLNAQVPDADPTSALPQVVRARSWQ